MLVTSSRNAGVRQAAVTKKPASPASRTTSIDGYAASIARCSRGAAAVDDAVDDPHPLEEREREGDDRGLADRRNSVVPARADEQEHEAGGEQRVAAEVEPVRDRRHRRIRRDG